MLKASVDEIVIDEITKRINEQGYVIVEDLKKYLMQTTGYSHVTITGGLSRARQKLGLVQRYSTNDIKKHYNIDCKGQVKILLKTNY